MIVIVGETYLDLDKVNSILIRYEQNKTITSNVKWWNPFTWGMLPTVTDDPNYVLTMDYTRDGRGWSLIVKNTDYSVLQNKFKSIVSQLKMQVDVQNQEMLDKLFEATIRGDDK